MKCLRKYKWVKLPRMHLPSGKGLMGYWAKLASRAAFRKGNAVYCGHINPVTAGMWSGGVVGLKSILGVKKRVQALWIMNQLQDFGYISYSLAPKTKQLTYQINDWVLNDIRKAGKKINVRGSDSERLNCMIAWRSRDWKTGFAPSRNPES